MFDVLVESTSARRSMRTWAYFGVSSVVWTLILAIVAVAGIVTYDAELDADFSALGVVVYAPPPPPAATRVVPETRPAPPNNLRSANVQPDAVRPPEPHPPTLGSASPHGVDVGGSAEGLDTGEPFGTGITPSAYSSTGPVHVEAPSAPPTEPAPAVAPPAPRRPVSRVLSGIVSRRVEPKYPEMARRAGVRGDVVVEVVVSETGEVTSANVVSGHPLLRDAALQAARAWHFTPTLLAGTPVKVVGTITFCFKL